MGRKGNPYTRSVGSYICEATMENSMKFLKELPCNTAIMFPGKYPQTPLIYKNIWVPVFLEALFTIAKTG